ncbi:PLASMODESMATA CALLOSE-BINDING PROTEIN 2-like [Nicotiana tabacum]|uniref:PLASMODESMATA CALLOSE-BINDING PROTEIN 2-like n=2 Tax=Nicotiana TaxID=4085 RepID=A0A1S4DE88_TOBAC|nr:PREDICTED: PLASMODESMATA CALLOSE-BINDING PROTEIN 3-like [Nicotiana sylvestris]XP_016511770.1 PREDICTED: PLASMODESMATA CALLOSE-BINDING PROTEIN 3-like [Nicotiana tabacum]
MATFVLFSVLFLAITGHSSAMFCICKDGVSDQQLQKNIDYACGAGADCTPILQNGACFNPNTIKDHCNYAVNSYYQRKGAAGASCDFSGTATTSPNPPTTTGSGCVYQSTPGNTGGGTTTPTIAPPGSTTPPIAPPGTTTPTLAPPGTTIPTTAPPGTTTPGIGTGIATTPGTNNPVFGLGPSGSGISNTDGNAAGHFKNSVILTIALLAISLIICLRA